MSVIRTAKTWPQFSIAVLAWNVPLVVPAILVADSTAVAAVLAANILGYAEGRLRPHPPRRRSA